MLPDEIIKVLPAHDYRFLRYEIRIGFDKESDEVGILEESAYLLTEKAIQKKEKDNQRELFPAFCEYNSSIINKKKLRGNSRTILSKKPGKNDNFYVETKSKAGKGWMPSFKFGIKKSAMGNLPADETKFPAASWKDQKKPLNCFYETRKLPVLHHSIQNSHPVRVIKTVSMLHS